MKHWKVMILFSIGFLTFEGSSLFALNSEMNRSTLQGLKGMMVLVEDLAPEVERLGLLKSQLQKGTEGKLQTAGIKILTQEEAAQTPGEPYLYLNINITLSKGAEEACSYSVDLALIQNVTLVRDPKQTTYAITWSTGGVGLIGKKSLPDLKDTVGEVVDMFIKAYQSVNSPKAP